MRDYQILDKCQTGELAKLIAESGQSLFPAAAAFLSREKQFRRISGYQHLWVIASALGRKETQNQAKAA